MPAACNDRGWMWPDAARCLATLAPNLAPDKPLSKANVPRIEHKADSPNVPTVSRRARGEQELQGCSAARPAAAMNSRLLCTRLDGAVGVAPLQAGVLGGADPAGSAVCLPGAARKETRAAWASDPRMR